MKIKKNIQLAKYTTFRIGGPARYFVVAKTKEEIIEAVKFAKTKKLPHFILGRGSNLLVNDDGFSGLVIKLLNSEFRILHSKIIAEAGADLGKLVIYSVGRGLTGLEWAAGIPGTIGGAVRGNAGAFGQSISESVKKVRVLNSELRVRSYDWRDLRFSYRDSIFKHNSDIIIEVVLQFKKGNKEESRKLIKGYLEKRGGRHPLQYPSAGCVFKNLPSQSAGSLIEQCGLKGKKIGQAMISKKHANFIINLNGAKAKDVIKLIQLIKKTVQKKFEINLEEEIEYLGL